MSFNASAILDQFARNYKATLAGVALTLGLLWGLLQSFGITVPELWIFITQHRHVRDTVAEQLMRINEKVENAEAASHYNHIAMLAIVQQMGGSGQLYRDILQTSAENHDFIRAFVELGRIYATLVKLGDHTDQTHDHLSSLYQALLEVNADNPFDESSRFNDDGVRQAARASGESLCETFPDHAICRARDHLVSIEREIKHFPRSVRDDVEIEVLRYLSYCSARAEETNQQRIYTERAEEIYRAAEEDDRIDDKLYRRKYFWIHYSRLVLIVGAGHDNYQAESWEYYNLLRRKLATEQDFLLRKLLQHSNLITEPDKQVLWDSFIRQSRVS
jgi:hypothetical protein